MVTKRTPTYRIGTKGGLSLYDAINGTGKAQQGVSYDAYYAAGHPGAASPDRGDYITKLNQLPGANPAKPTTLPSRPGGGSSRLSRGRSAAAAAASEAARKAKLSASADKLYEFNRAPWLEQYALNNEQRDQVNAYNPDFDKINQQYAGLSNQANQAYQGDVAARVQQLAGLQRTLGSQQGQQMQGVLRDLGNQGFGQSVNPYVQNAMAGNAGITQNIANQGNFNAAMGETAAASNRDALRLGGLVTAGGKASLANNKLASQNQLATLRQQIMAQQAAAEQANSQAKQQFLINNKVY